MIKQNTILAAAAFASVLAVGSAQAAIVPIAGVTASSTFFTYDVNNLINGSGLAGGLHSGDFHDKWMTDLGDHGLLIFDLGSTKALTGATVWNYGGGCCGEMRSVQDLHILGSNDGAIFYHIKYFTLAETPTDPIPGQDLAFSASYRYVMFDLLTNYGDGYTGLSEVQFTDGRGVPEPAVWALMLSGFGLAGGALRRRSRALAA